VTSYCVDCADTKACSSHCHVLQFTYAGKVHFKAELLAYWTSLGYFGFNVALSYWFVSVSALLSLLNIILQKHFISSLSTAWDYSTLSWKATFCLLLKILVRVHNDVEVTIIRHCCYTTGLY